MQLHGSSVEWSGHSQGQILTEAFDKEDGYPGLSVSLADCGPAATLSSWSFGSSAKPHRTADLIKTEESHSTMQSQKCHQAIEWLEVSHRPRPYRNARRWDYPGTAFQFGGSIACNHSMVSLESGS